MPKDEREETLEYLLMRTELAPFIKLNIKRLRRLRNRTKKESDDYYDFKNEIDAWENIKDNLMNHF